MPIKNFFYYVPATFRVCRLKSGVASIVAIKSISGGYAGDAKIKELTGFHVKDTGAAQEELITREVTGAVKEYSNEWYDGISLIKKGWREYQKTYGYKLHHPLGFDFFINWNELETFIVDRKIDIINKVFQCKFRFSLNTLSNEVVLISERCNYNIKTDDDINNLRKSMSTVKTKDLVVGKVYKYYRSTDPTDDINERILYMGKIPHSKWLLKGDYYRPTVEYIPDVPYLVFVILKTSDNVGTGYYDTSAENVITGHIGPNNIILMKSAGHKLRQLDDNQSLHLIAKSGDPLRDPIDITDLKKHMQRKIDYFNSLNNKN